MLYQTHHHPLFFHFKPFSSSSIHPLPSATTTPAPTSLSPLSSSHSSSQVEKEMACVEGALKGSFRKEMALKSNHHQALLLEDMWTANGQSGVVVSVEDFSVDDLLDFSKMGGADEDEKEKTKEDEEDKSCVSLSSPHQHHQQQQQELTTKENSNNHGGNLGFKDDFGSSELSVPVDDVANLEWLSHFVEDSFSEYSLPFPAGNLTAKPKSTPEKKPTTTEEPPSMKNPCFATPVPAKARTKRTRTGGRRWSFGSTTESSSSSSSSSTTSTTSSPSTSWLIYTTPSHIVDSFNSLTRPPVKKQKRRIASESGGGGYGGGTSQPPRRCSHCGVQKTPQWRAGPQGAKTLCNACGVRYKSGRLLPEYRPACSPTFSSEVHSNHHRKVLEMRKKKEPVGSEPGLAPAVTSF